jgi:hypothetical protein
VGRGAVDRWGRARGRVKPRVRGCSIAPGLVNGVLTPQLEMTDSGGCLCNIHCWPCSTVTAARLRRRMLLSHPDETVTHYVMDTWFRGVGRRCPGYLCESGVVLLISALQPAALVTDTTCREPRRIRTRSSLLCAEELACWTE